MPEMASTTKAPAFDQCVARSKGVKRSILRPVLGAMQPDRPRVK